MPKNRIITIIIIGFLIFLIINSIKSVLDLRKAGRLVNDYEADFKKAEKENLELKDRLKEVQKPEFIEREAREKLGLAKPGESIIIMPEITPKPAKIIEPKLANWEKWWRLFF